VVTYPRIRPGVVTYPRIRPGVVTCPQDLCMMSGAGGGMGDGFHNNGEGSARPGGCKAPAIGRGRRCPAFRRAGCLAVDMLLCRCLYKRPV